MALVRAGGRLLFALHAQFRGHEVAGNQTLAVRGQVDDGPPVAVRLVHDLHSVALPERHVRRVAGIVVVEGDHDAAPVEGRSGGRLARTDYVHVPSLLGVRRVARTVQAAR